MSMESIQGQVPAASCPHCGAPLGTAMPGGLCPRCLLEGVAASTEAGTERAEGGVGMAAGGPDLSRLAEVFPEYELHGLIGAGGMGEVYKARQPHLDRWVALKILPEAMATHAAFVERFQREARTLARLNHPNIVTVHDYGRRGGFCFLVMEYVDGVNLRQAMRAGRMPPAEALGLVPKICEALQFAHDEGVLHRDIKPENILLDSRGRVKIADFGIAKLVGEAAADASLTVSGATLGTPAYMAPEQIERPSEVDHRADIYSLGVVFYEMLTGELPLGRFAPPSEKAPMDRRVDEIVMRALAKERELRQQSASQVRTEVEGVSGTSGDLSSKRVVAGGTGRSHSESSKAVPDFVLCHPYLPRMAQWITVYALIVFPMLWLVGLSWLEDPEKATGPYEPMLLYWQNLIMIVGDLVVAILFAVGGMKLRSLKVTGPRLLRGAIWLHFGLGLLVMALEIVLEGVRKVSKADTLPPGEAWIAVVGVACMAFEISALVWLSRNKHTHRLALIFAEASPGISEAADEVALTATREGVTRHATKGAMLTGLSVVFGMGLIGGVAMLVVAAWQGRLGQMGGLGPAELVLGLIALLGIGGGGVVGAVLGWSGLREIKMSGGKLGGLGRCLVASMGWPLIVMECAILIGAGWVVHRFGGGFLALIGIAGLGGLMAAELVMRSVWRWVRGTPRGGRAGRLPGVCRGLAIAAILANAVTLFPAYSVGWSHYFRSQIPPMVAVLRPSGVSGWEVECPPRSIVHFETRVFRDRVMLAEPLYRAHVVNGSLWEPATVPLRFSTRVESASAGHPAPAWSMELASKQRTVSFKSSRHLSPGAEWHDAGGTKEATLRVGEAPWQSERVLYATGPDGDAWEVAVRVRVEPLTPQYLFEGAMAGQGEDWEATAKYAVSLEKKDGDE